MSLTFTTDTLRAAYNFLNETPPFSRWNLPDGEDVVFKVVRDRKRYAWHDVADGKHTIALSSVVVGHTNTLVRTMAHEMVHVHERTRTACATGHSKAWVKWAAQVCQQHGFDPKDF